MYLTSVRPLQLKPIRPAALATIATFHARLDVAESKDVLATRNSHSWSMWLFTVRLPMVEHGQSVTGLAALDTRV